MSQEGKANVTQPLQRELCYVTCFRAGSNIIRCVYLFAWINQLNIAHKIVVKLDEQFLQLLQTVKDKKHWLKSKIHNITL